MLISAINCLTLYGDKNISVLYCKEKISGLQRANVLIIKQNHEYR